MIRADKFSDFEKRILVQLAGRELTMELLQKNTGLDYDRLVFYIKRLLQSNVVEKLVGYPTTFAVAKAHELEAQKIKAKLDYSDLKTNACYAIH
jgi:hypothetical protein